MSEIKYIGFYDIAELNQNRNAQLSAINKMNYIIDILNRLNYSVKVISPGWSKSNKNIKFTQYKKDGNEYIMPFSFRDKSIYKAFNHIFCMLWLLKYLLFNCKKNEQVIVYHSLYFMKIISIVKKLKKISIILEVEEIYSDVIKANDKFRKKELKYITNADKFIFVSDILRKELNIGSKKSCVINGNYKIEDQIVEKFNDNKIHLVYSGIIDYSKGAFTAVTLSEYLDEHYEVHIIGYGEKDIVEDLKKQINLKNKTNKCRIVYDGIKKDKEYVKYIQKCDVGLSIQDSNATYNYTSFPSKILSYLSNGLRVVSVNLLAINSSDVGNLIYFYDGNEVDNIVKVIRNINFDDNYDSRNYIKNLDVKLLKEIEDILYEKN